MIFIANGTSKKVSECTAALFNLLVFVMMGASTLCCGSPKDYEDLKRTRSELQQQVEELQREKASLEARLQELQETDQAVWSRSLAEQSKGNWTAVAHLTGTLIARWPQSPLAAEAERLRLLARNNIADELLRRADAQRKAGSSVAVSTLRTLVNEYAETPAAKQAQAKLRVAEAQLRPELLSGTGKWTVTTEVSPIDDSTNVYLSLSSSDRVSTDLKTATPSLMLRCKENKTEAFIVWGIYLGIDETDVLTRFDSERAAETSWSVSTSHESTFFSGSDVAFIKRMLRHERLLARTTPYGESPVTASFDLAGLSKAIEPLQRACGWK